MADPNRRTAGSCPWCGSGTELAIEGDGLGNLRLACTACGCKGPPAPIADDFAAADIAAITRWSTRPAVARPVSRDVLERIRLSIGFETSVAGPAAARVHVPIKLADLNQLLEAALPVG